MNEEREFAAASQQQTLCEQSVMKVSDLVRESLLSCEDVHAGDVRFECLSERLEQGFKAISLTHWASKADTEDTTPEINRRTKGCTGELRARYAHIEEPWITMGART